MASIFLGCTSLVVIGASYLPNPPFMPLLFLGLLIMFFSILLLPVIDLWIEGMRREFESAYPEIKEEWPLGDDEKKWLKRKY